MGMEGGPEFINRNDIDRPQTIEGSIEGKPETSHNEIDFDQANHIPLYDIQWGNVASLHFTKVGSYDMPSRLGMTSKAPLYVADLSYTDYAGEKEQISLSSFFREERRVLFTGTTNGFYAHDPAMIGSEDPFYIVGIVPDELQQKMTRLCSVYHELGHTFLFAQNADAMLFNAALSLKAKDLPHILQAKLYGEEVARAVPDKLRDIYPIKMGERAVLFQVMRKNTEVDRSVRLFHERNAWAAGANLVRAYEFPTGFSNSQSYYEYARLCLESYSRHFKDNKFVFGWKNFPSQSV